MARGRVQLHLEPWVPAQNSPEREPQGEGGRLQGRGGARPVRPPRLGVAPRFLHACSLTSALAPGTLRLWPGAGLGAGLGEVAPPVGGTGGRPARRGGPGLRRRLEKSCLGQSVSRRGILSRHSVQRQGRDETTGSAARPADSLPGVAPGHGTAGRAREWALRPGQAAGGLSCRDAGCASRARPPGRWRRCAGL